MSRLVTEKRHVNGYKRRKPHGRSKTVKVSEYNRRQRVSKLSPAEVRRIQQGRTPRAKDIDMRKKAPIPANERSWADHPNRYDLEGVDTPKEVVRETAGQIPKAAKPEPEGADVHERQMKKEREGATPFLDALDAELKRQAELQKRINAATTIKELSDIEKEINERDSRLPWQERTPERIKNSIFTREETIRLHREQKKHEKDVKEYEKIHGQGSYIPNQLRVFLKHSEVNGFSTKGYRLPKIEDLPGGKAGIDAPYAYFNPERTVLTIPTEEMNKKPEYKRRFEAAIAKAPKVSKVEEGERRTLFRYNGGRVVVSNEYLEQAKVELGGNVKIYPTGDDTPIVVKGAHGYRLIAPVFDAKEA